MPTSLKWEIYDLAFAVSRCRRYHEKLVKYYEGWQTAGKIIVVVSGSGAFLLLVGQLPFAATVATVATAVVSLWGILDIVFAPGKKAVLHAELLGEFTTLAAKIAVMPKDEGALRALQAERLDLEKKEPPCKRLVDLMARNDECRAQNYPPEDLVPLSPLQRRLGYFFTFDMVRIEKWRDERATAKKQIKTTSAASLASPPTA